jgi:inhibitor of KinA
MTFTSYGPNSVLIHFADKPGDWAFQKCRAIVAELEQRPPPGLIDFAPGYTNILLEFDASARTILETIAARVVTQLEGAARKKLPLGRVNEIPVAYNGPDLQRVAEHNKITVEQVVQYHTARTYKVYLLGFALGFPYLGDLHHRLRTPRLASPRTKVPAGSIGIGGDQTGIYTIDSPGGWNIIGHTKVPIFKPDRGKPGAEEDAFLLKQGDQVKFVRV